MLDSTTARTIAGATICGVTTASITAASQGTLSFDTVITAGIGAGVGAMVTTIGGSAPARRLICELSHRKSLQRMVAGDFRRGFLHDPDAMLARTKRLCSDFLEAGVADFDKDKRGHACFDVSGNGITGRDTRDLGRQIALAKSVLGLEAVRVKFPSICGAIAATAKNMSDILGAAGILFIGEPSYSTGRQLASHGIGGGVAPDFLVMAADSFFLSDLVDYRLMFPIYDSPGWLYHVPRSRGTGAPRVHFYDRSASMIQIRLKQGLPARFDEVELGSPSELIETAESLEPGEIVTVWEAIESRVLRRNLRLRRIEGTRYDRCVCLFAHKRWNQSYRQVQEGRIALGQLLQYCWLKNSQLLRWHHGRWRLPRDIHMLLSAGFRQAFCDAVG